MQKICPMPPCLASCGTHHAGPSQSASYHIGSCHRNCRCSCPAPQTTSWPCGCCPMPPGTKPWPEVFLSCPAHRAKAVQPTGQRLSSSQGKGLEAKRLHMLCMFLEAVQPSGGYTGLSSPPMAYHAQSKNVGCPAQWWIHRAVQPTHCKAKMWAVQYKHEKCQSRAFQPKAMYHHVAFQPMPAHPCKAAPF